MGVAIPGAGGGRQGIAGPPAGQTGFTSSRELDLRPVSIHSYDVDPIAILGYAALLLAGWAILSVIVSIPLAAVFRLQARGEQLWEEAERRRAWREALQR